MDPYPLVKDQIIAGRQLLDLFHEVHPIQVAYWLNPPGDGYWELNIVTGPIDDPHDPSGYDAVIRISNELDNPDLDAFRVKVVKYPTSLASAVLELRNKNTDNKPIRLRGAYLGGTVAEDLYVYPSFMKSPAHLP